MGISTPVPPSSGGGGSGEMTVRDESSNVSGTVDEIIFPQGSLSISGDVATLRQLPAGGASFSGLELADATISMALTMNETSSPIFDNALGAFLEEAGGSPSYEETGFFSGGSAIKLGRAFGCLSRNSNGFLAPTATTYGAHTMNMWAKPEGNGSTEVGYFFSFYNSSSSRIYLFNDTTSIRFGEISGATSNLANVTYADLAALDNPIDIFDGSFHQFTCVREHDGTGQHLYFYIDGQLVAENNNAVNLGNMGASTTVFNIAGQNDVATSGAIITCDEFVISPQKWTQAMIVESYNGGVGVSFADVTSPEYGFEEAALTDLNDYITHVWRMNETSGSVAGDSKGLVALLGYDDVERGVTGRFTATATRINGFTGSTSAHRSRFTRYQDFDGPDANTPFMISFDVKINSTQVGSSGSLFEVLTEMGLNNGRGSSNRQGLSIVAGPALGTWNDFSGVTSGSIASIIGDGNFHTITWGQRYIGGGATKEIFVSIDGTLSTNNSSVTWSNCSVTNVSFNIGHSIEWYSGSSNDRVGDFDIQNVVMWQGVSPSDAQISALNGAELVEL